MLLNIIAMPMKPLDLCWSWLICVLSSFVLITNVNSCQLNKFEDVPSRTVAARVVFEGKLALSSPTSTGTSDSGVTRVTFTVQKLIKGNLPSSPPGQILQVVVGSPVPSCLAGLNVDQPYLVFLNGTRMKFGKDPTLYWISSSPVTHSKKLVKEAETFSCKECGQKPNARLTPKNVVLKKDVIVDVTLNCLVKGKPSPTITWFKDKNQLESNNHTEITTSFSSQKISSQLKIKKADSTDIGSYWCQATNVLATASSLKMKISKGKKKPKNEGSIDYGKPCPNDDHCFKKGKCYENALLGTFCVCDAGYSGIRCQQKGSSSDDLLKGSVDEILSFIGIFLVAIVLVTLIVILYCLLKFRHQYTQDRKQFMLKNSFALNSAKMNGVKPMMIDPNATRNAVIAALRMESEIEELNSQLVKSRTPQRDEPWLHAQSGGLSSNTRISTSSSQGLIGTEDETDLTKASAQMPSFACPGEKKIDEKHLEKKVCKNPAKDTELNADLKQDLQLQHAQDLQIMPAAASYSRHQPSEKETEQRLDAEVNAILQELGAYMISSKPTEDRHIPVDSSLGLPKDAGFHLSGPNQINNSKGAVV